MVATINAPVLLFAGEELLFTFQLAAAGVPTDPSSGAFSYGVPSRGAPVTVALSALTHVGPGVYTYLLDTTNLVADLYVEQIISTGVIAVDIEYFVVQARPLG
ncbi:MAG TPA: hypothetical protein VIJ31_12165 [Acidothermaceae bacterium]